MAKHANLYSTEAKIKFNASLFLPSPWLRPPLIRYTCKCLQNSLQSFNIVVLITVIVAAIQTLSYCKYILKICDDGVLKWQTFWTLSIVYLWSKYDFSETGFCLRHQIKGHLLCWAQWIEQQRWSGHRPAESMSFYLMTETDSRLRNVVCFWSKIEDGSCPKSLVILIKLLV
jgi:hypothetical protein